jgi:hypothetical protein
MHKAYDGLRIALQVKLGTTPLRARIIVES